MFYLTKRKIKLFTLAVSLFLTILFIVFNNEDNGKTCFGSDCVLFNESKIEILNTRNELGKNFYTILEYTKVIGENRFCKHYLEDNLIEEFKNNDEFNKIFSSNSKENNGLKYQYLDNCEFKNCFFTCNSDFIETADALVFSYGDFIGDLEYNQTKIKNLVDKRNPDQIWIMWNDEAAIPLKKYDYLYFNWSMTFYQTSEVWNFAYGGIVNAEKNDILITSEIINEEFNKRSNSAIWFVSNCGSKIRNKFASELGDYYSLIIGGDCAYWISGSKITRSVKKSKCERDSACETDYMTHNKFYLAFESINCTDYITEKFWRSLSYGLIPIVFQPSKESYKRIAPIDSFIHAQDFNYNPKRLAEYLNKVSNDKELYFKHLKWKSMYRNYYKANDVEPFRLCQLCKKLNKETKLIYYKSLSSWTRGSCSS